MKIFCIIFCSLLVAVCSMSIGSQHSQQDKFPEQIPSPGAFEGDILLTEKQRATLERLEEMEDLDDPEPNARKAINSLSSRWPNKLVRYSISSSSEPDRSAIEQALMNWRDVTCLNFEEVAPDSSQSHIHVIKGGGCYSYVGYIGVSGQELSIGQGCAGIGTIMHEFGHAIGFFHEQSRPDRDSHIRVNFENIQSGLESQFEKYPTSTITTEDVPYDVGSIMHYGETYFSKNGLPTIHVLNPLERAKLGNRNNLSFNDIKLANLVYQCNAECDSLDCQNEGYVGPLCTCVCKDGFFGPRCELQDFECSYTTEEPVGVIDSPNYPDNYEDNTYCTVIIKALVGETITLTFEEFDLESANSCSYDYVEVRDNVDGFENTQRMCGSVIPRPITSVGNEMAVVFRSDGSRVLPGFLASYVINRDVVTTESDRDSTTAVPSTTNTRPTTTTADPTTTRPITTTTGPATTTTRPTTTTTDSTTTTTTTTTTDSTTTRPTPTTTDSTTVRPTTTADPITTTIDTTTTNSGIIVDGCNIQSTLESGQFKSPNYPSPYDNDLDCTYTIIAEENQIITLSFTEFDIEQHRLCLYDYVLIEGIRYCGSLNSPRTFTSDTGSITFALHSDFSITGRGFVAEYNVRTLDGTYSSFSDWSECVLDESCGGFKRFRMRTCDKGHGRCSGPAVEIEECANTV